MVAIADDVENTVHATYRRMLLPKNRVKSLLLVVNDQCHPVNYIVAGVDVLCLRVKISPFPNTEAHPGGVHTRFLWHRNYDSYTSSILQFNFHCRSHFLSL